MARTIQSPGVEIREVDFTIRPVQVIGTSVFLAGFADQGPIDEVLQPGSVSEFEQVYGQPTNAAEQYFYQTAKAVLGQSPGRLLTTRLPYGPDKGDGFNFWRYSALVYPARPILTTEATNTTTRRGISAINFTNTGAYSAIPDVGVTGGTVLVQPQFSVSLSANAATSINGVNFYPLEITVVSPGVFQGPVVPSFTVESLVDEAGNATPAAATFGMGSATLFTSVTGTQSTSNNSFKDANVYLFGKPTHVEITAEQYQAMIENNINWLNAPSVNNQATPFTFENLNGAGMIVLNKAQTSVNNTFEGYYVGIIDNNNYNPATPFNGVLSVEGIQAGAESINNYITLPPQRLNFSLSATKFGDGTSISEVMENLTQIDLNTNSFDDTVSMGVFKLRKSIYSPDTISLEYTLAESYVGSLDYRREIADQTGGPAKTFYVGSLADNSNNIRVIVNPFISNQYTNTWLTSAGVPGKKVRFLGEQLATPLNSPGYIDTETTYLTRIGATSAAVIQAYQQLGAADSLFTLGVYSNTVATDKSIGGLVKKLERAFELVENPDVYQINLALEGGLGTVFVNSLAQSNNSNDSDYLSAGPYLDSRPLNALSGLYTTNPEGLSQDGRLIRSQYTAVANVFVVAAEKQRKDFMVILDPIRNIFVQGTNSKVASSKKQWSPNAGLDPDPFAPGYVTTNFSQHIYWPLRHQFSTINSSYATTYGTWVQVIDSVTNRQIWIPFSGYAAATMSNTDQNFQPWFAPAGFTRGIVTGVNDIGVYPKQKQRDQLYKSSINPVAFFPAEGFVIFGQKTLLKKPSAFDRINVRRLFLNLEVAVRDTVKFFVFEPNTLFTRTQIVNTLSPIFDNAKNTEGLYDYLIVCDERNNTPDVIDNNELKVDIYIKPVRTAEFILVTFYATRTGQNFQELIGE
jgi:phage tail sheath protein FI